jgi:hypothetical protein
VATPQGSYPWSVAKPATLLTRDRPALSTLSISGSPIAGLGVAVANCQIGATTCQGSWPHCFVAQIGR